MLDKKCHDEVTNIKREDKSKSADKKDKNLKRNERNDETKCDIAIQTTKDSKTTSDTREEEKSKRVQSPRKQSKSRRKCESTSSSEKDISPPVVIEQAKVEIIECMEPSNEVIIEQSQPEDSQNEAIDDTQNPSNDEIKVLPTEPDMSEVANEIVVASDIIIESPIEATLETPAISNELFFIEGDSHCITNEKEQSQQNQESTELKLHPVPIEIGPNYRFESKEEVVSETILDLPLNSNEEVIFDSRDLEAEKSTIKSPENESFDSTKENSGSNSMSASCSSKAKKRKVVTTEVEDDGTVVFTIVRKKKRKIAKT